MVYIPRYSNSSLVSFGTYYLKFVAWENVQSVSSYDIIYFIVEH